MSTYAYTTHVYMSGDKLQCTVHAGSNTQESNCFLSHYNQELIHRAMQEEEGWELYTALYSSIQHCTALYSTIQLYTALYSSIQHCTALYSTVQLYTALYSSIQHCTALYSTVQLYTALYSSIQHCTALYSTVQLYTALYSSIQHCFWVTSHHQQSVLSVSLSLTPRNAYNTIASAVVHIHAVHVSHVLMYMKNNYINLSLTVQWCSYEYFTFHSNTTQ